MAKDRTRHARLREPERAGVSLYGMVAQGMAQALVGFSEETAQVLYDVSYAAVVGIGDFCCAVKDCLLDLAKKMEEAENGRR